MGSTKARHIGLNSANRNNHLGNLQSHISHSICPIETVDTAAISSANGRTCNNLSNDLLVVAETPDPIGNCEYQNGV